MSFDDDLFCDSISTSVFLQGLIDCLGWQGECDPILKTLSCLQRLTSPANLFSSYSGVFPELSPSSVAVVFSCSKHVIQSFLRWSKISLLWNCYLLLVLISLTVASFVPFSSIFEVYVLCVIVEIHALSGICIFVLKLGEFRSLSTCLICSLSWLGSSQVIVFSSFLNTSISFIFPLFRWTLYFLVLRYFHLNIWSNYFGTDNFVTFCIILVFYYL